MSPAKSRPVEINEHRLAIAEQVKAGAKVHPDGALVLVREKDKPPLLVGATVVSWHFGLVPFYTLDLDDGRRVRRCAQRVKRMSAKDARARQT